MTMRCQMPDLPATTCFENTCVLALDPTEVREHDLLHTCSTDDECATVVTDCCGTEFDFVNAGGQNVWADVLRQTAGRCAAVSCVQPDPPPDARCVSNRCVSAVQ